VRARLLVRALTGQELGAGPWALGTGPRALPSRLLRSGRAGAVWVRAEARDSAGHRTVSAPTVVTLPGPRGPARAVRAVRTARPWVALTIDDGYDAGTVRSMVATATRLRAPVLMCINGAAARGYSPALVRDLRAATRAGWVQACSHGHSHATGAGTSYGAAHADLRSSLAWDLAAGQSTVPFYRPPYGAIGPGIMRAATDLGYRHVLLWDVDTNDWRHRSAAHATAHVLRNARRGSIVLLHAIPSSAAALPGIITGLRARGLEPVAIGDLLAAGPAS